MASINCFGRFASENLIRSLRSPRMPLFDIRFRLLLGKLLRGLAIFSMKASSVSTSPSGTVKSTSAGLSETTTSAVAESLDSCHYESRAADQRYDQKKRPPTQRLEMQFLIAMFLVSDIGQHGPCEWRGRAGQKKAFRYYDAGGVRSKHSLPQLQKNAAFSGPASRKLAAAISRQEPAVSQYTDRPPAVDRQANSGHKVAFREKQHGLGDVFRPARATKVPSTARSRTAAVNCSGKSTGPGNTAFTRTRGASSTANVRVIVGIAPFETKYAL